MRSCVTHRAWVSLTHHHHWYQEMREDDTSFAWATLTASPWEDYIQDSAARLQVHPRSGTTLPCRVLSTDVMLHWSFTSTIRRSSFAARSTHQNELRWPEFLRQRSCCVEQSSCRFAITGHLAGHLQTEFLFSTVHWPRICCLGEFARYKCLYYYYYYYYGSGAFCPCPAVSKMYIKVLMKIVVINGAGGCLR